MVEPNLPPVNSECQTYKKCTKCGKEKLFAEFNNSSSKKCKDGKFFWCKACVHAGQKEYRERNAERIAAGRRAKYAENPEPCREYMRRRYNNDPGARRAASVEWRKANPEKRREMNRVWYISNANKAKAAAKAYRDANLEKCRAASRRYHKDHYQKNKHQYYLASSARRAMKAGAIGKLSRGIRKRLFFAQNGLCAYCHTLLGDLFHLDHIIPLAKCGTHTDDNVQLLCPQCNLSKGAKMPDEFIKYMESRI